MARFLVISDLHLHNWSNIPILHQEEKLWDVISYALENEIKYILFCGDAFHTHGRIPTTALRVWNKFLLGLKKFDIKIFGISGNHDHADAEGKITPLDSLNLVGKCLDDTQVVNMEGIPVVGFTYSDDPEKVKNFFHDLPQNCILLLHQGVSGVEVNSKGFTLNESLKASFIPDRVLHCFSGHYHTHKVVSNKLTIPGALFQHNWGDAGEKRGFLDCYIDSKGTHIKQVHSTRPSEFLKIEYSDWITPTKDVPLNIKVINVPNGTIINEDQEILYLNNTSITIEFEKIEETSPEIIRSDNFSVEDFFEEYISKKEMPEKNLEIGRQLIGR